MEIKLTNEEAETYFHNALCNGLAQIQSYNLEVVYKTEDYDKAKMALDNPCFEDVLLQILKDGNKLTMHDWEEGTDDAEITLQMVHERLPKTERRHLINMIEENDDADTADVILQTVFYENVIFG